MHRSYLHHAVASIQTRTEIAALQQRHSHGGVTPRRPPRRSSALEPGLHRGERGRVVHEAPVAPRLRRPRPRVSTPPPRCTLHGSGAEELVAITGAEQLQKMLKRRGTQGRCVGAGARHLRQAPRLLQRVPCPNEARRRPHRQQPHSALCQTGDPRRRRARPRPSPRAVYDIVLRRARRWPVFLKRRIILRVNTWVSLVWM